MRHNPEVSEVKRYIWILLLGASLVSLCSCGGPMYAIYLALEGEDDSKKGGAVVIRVPVDYPTIQEAIDAAVSGNTVLVADGTYTGPDNKDLDLRTKAITIRSENGPEKCIIDCETSGRGFYFPHLYSPLKGVAAIDGFTIRNGNVIDQGGAIYCGDNFSPRIINCIMTNNSANDGGAIYCSYGTSPVILNCTITNNSAFIGGAIRCNGSTATITGCTITNNSAIRHAGAICCWEGAHATIRNCLISDNTVSGAYDWGSGGGIYCNSSSPTIINCTISNNTSANTGSGSYRGGGIHCENNSNPTLNNTILWDNTATDGGNEIYTADGASSVTLSYCDYANGFMDVQGIGMIIPDNCMNVDPQFVDAAAQDYHLRRASPCIDAGDDSVVTWSEDLDGRRRIWDPDVDIGAYEGGWLLVPVSYGTIQGALNAASDGDVVLVEDGTYTGPGNKYLDFMGKKVWLRSRSGPAGCIIDCQAAGRGFYFGSNETGETIVEGFTIQNGNASTDHGGAIQCYFDSSPTIKDCILASNSTNYQGGGIYCHTSSPIITGCTIMNNSASVDGGGIYCEYSSPTITNCVVTNNTAGAGSEQGGGGICCRDDSHPAITGCIIKENSASLYGGGIYCDSNANPAISNCMILDNSADYGGGIYCNDSCAPAIAGCLITGNVSSNTGGGVRCWNNSHPTITNCTIVDNSAGTGGGICTNNSTPTVNNTILWDNTASTMGNQICPDNSASVVILNNCDYADGPGDVEGDGRVAPNNCINSDPLFKNAPAGDYHLRPGSPCVDAGNNSLVPGSLMTDLDGESRIKGASVDMGPYEEGWLLVPSDYGTIQAAIDAARSGEEVLVLDGIYTGVGNKDLDFAGKVITVRSENGPANCIIDCQYSGRGFYFCSGEGAAARVEGFTIRNGNVSDSGGAVACERSSPTITNCIIVDNSAWLYGGGIHCWDRSYPSITNCIIAYNWSNSDGGGICSGGSGLTLTNCTIAYNSSGTWGGGIFCLNSSILNNTIVWGNTASSSGNQIYTYNSTSTVYLNYCDYTNGAGDVQGAGTVTPNNCISLDPLFADAAGGDYALRGTSPCIDAGSDPLVGVGVTADPAGNPRLLDGDNDTVALVDIGAYEHRTWTQRLPVSSPSGRYGQGMAYDSRRGAVLLFGGWDTNYCDDTWEWDGTTWTQRSPANRPSARFTQMTYDSRRAVVVLFGGYDGTDCSDTWEWDGTNWTQRFPANNPPLRRTHALAYDRVRGVVVLFGGWDGGTPFDDTWEWDGNDWTQRFPANRPAGRIAHKMVYDSIRGEVVLFGGFLGGGVYSSETWTWDGTNWVQEFPAGRPPGRSRHGMVYDSSRGVTVLFGGYDSGASLGDTWEWDGANWAQKFPFEAPSARQTHGMVYDAARAEAVLFGGTIGSNETWEY